MRTRHPRRRLAVAATLALALLAPFAATAPAAAAPVNPVIAWDRLAETVSSELTGQQPNEQVRSLAMVNGAVYDAVNAIAGTPYRPYLIAPPADGSESVEAAVATAAYRVLLALFPEHRQWLRARYQEALAAVPDGPAEARGIAVGALAAAAMITARRDDGAFGDWDWPTGEGPGQWRPTPPTFASGGAWTAHLEPFLVPGWQRFRTPGPPPLTSRAYARDLAEVAAVGAATSAVRTPDQTEAAIWWHDRRMVGWEIQRQLAITQGLDVLSTARLFALADLTGADALTACYREKERWSFWRPVTAIRLADTDGNRWTTADPEWTPLLVTPPFPEYPSGHLCGTGAMMAVYRAYFGRDDIPFSAYSVDADARRHYAGFSEAVAELLGARVWGGVHFRTADLHGLRLGEAIARYTVRHHLRPA